MLERAATPYLPNSGNTPTEFQRLLNQTDFERLSNKSHYLNRLPPGYEIIRRAWHTFGRKEVTTLAAREFLPLLARSIPIGRVLDVIELVDALDKLSNPEVVPTRAFPEWQTEGLVFPNFDGWIHVDRTDPAEWYAGSGQTISNERTVSYNAVATFFDYPATANLPMFHEGFPEDSWDYYYRVMAESHPLVSPVSEEALIVSRDIAVHIDPGSGIEGLSDDRLFTREFWVRGFGAYPDPFENGPTLFVSVPPSYDPNKLRHAPSERPDTPPTAAPAPEPVIKAIARQWTSKGRWSIPPAGRKPPGKNTKERKFLSRSKRFMAAMFGALDTISELSEIIDALYQSLPKRVRNRWEERYDFERGSALIDGAGQYGIDGADWKAQALWYNFQHIDPDQAFKNIVNNVTQDTIHGLLHKNLPVNSGAAGTEGIRAIEEMLKQHLYWK